MESEEKEILRFTTKEMLLSFFDGWAKLQTILGYPWQRAEAYKYLRQREREKDNYYTKIWKLEKQGYIKRSRNENEQKIKLTDQGKKKVMFYLADELKISLPAQWDKKWRLVAFDIPDNKKTARDVLAAKLKQLGFIRLQKSIFVFPFDCRKEIDYLKEIYQIKSFVRYIVVDQIDTEEKLLNHFLDKGILSRDN